MPLDTPLNDAALDQLFREARTYNGYLDKPVANAQLNGDLGADEIRPDIGQLPARADDLVHQRGSQGKAAPLAMPANADKILAAPSLSIIGMDMEFYEQLPELFPHADARSWFVGNER